MDNVNKNELQVTAENTAEAEKRETAAAELGKFKNVDALLNAYLALEAEFTRRSQRLKELEEGNKARDKDVRDAPSPEGETGSAERPPEITEDVKKAVIEEDLRAVSNKSIPLITNGVAPAAPRSAVKSVKEAGALAQRFLKKD